MRFTTYFTASCIYLLISCSNHSTESFNSFKKIIWSDSESLPTSTETTLLKPVDDIIRITDINRPSLEVFPAKGSGLKPAVLIFPGGGYDLLAYNLEGTEIAEWCNNHGITAIIVKYTVPNNREAAFKDGLQALKLTREHASEWKIDPDKIGVMGFSAGAHLSARISSSNYKSTSTSMLKELVRPDFSILIYPAYLESITLTNATEDIPFLNSSPPTFMVQTKDDSSFVDGTITYYNALKKNNPEVTFRLFETGGHGYGLRLDPSQKLSEWPTLLKSWFMEKGII